MSSISFACSRRDRVLVARIVKRAVAQLGVRDLLSLEMDLVATHANGNRIDFARLLAADDFTFAHDISGIRGYLDRRTGKLTNCFVPRCSAIKKKLRGRTSRRDKRFASELGVLL